MVTPEFDALQEETLADVQEIYSETVIDHALNPRNVGEMTDSDGYGSALGHCGDSIEIWLQVKDGKIVKAQFWTNGCAPTIASGSVLTDMVEGKQVLQAQRINQQDVIAALGGLPNDHQHCAVLAVNALKGAIKDYLAIKREPWKRVYRDR